MVEMLAIIGGTLVAGAYAYLAKGARVPEFAATNPAHSWRSTQPKSLAETVAHRVPDSEPAKKPGEEKANANTVKTDEEREALHHGLRTASLSLGLTTTGLLFLPPLQLAAVPTLIYMGVPSAQAAYDSLRSGRGLNRASAETIALAGCLAGGFYFTGSLGFCLYYLERTRRQDRKEAQAQKRHGYWRLPEEVTLQSEAGAVSVRTDTLQKGDHILVQSGQMIPIDGLVVDGSAWVQQSGLSGEAAEQFKQTGDLVRAADLVSLGSVCVQVRPAE